MNSRNAAPFATDMLICSRCFSHYHIYCLTPSLEAVPDGDWVCHVCTPGDIEHTANEPDAGNEPDTANETDTAANEPDPVTSRYPSVSAILERARANQREFHEALRDVMSILRYGINIHECMRRTLPDNVLKLMHDTVEDTKCTCHPKLRPHRHMMGFALDMWNEPPLETPNKRKRAGGYSDICSKCMQERNLPFASVVCTWKTAFCMLCNQHQTRKTTPYWCHGCEDILKTRSISSQWFERLQYFVPAEHATVSVIPGPATDITVSVRFSDGERVDFTVHTGDNANAPGYNLRLPHRLQQHHSIQMQLVFMLRSRAYVARAMLFRMAPVTMANIWIDPMCDWPVMHDDERGLLEF